MFNFIRRRIDDSVGRRRCAATDAVGATARRQERQSALCGRTRTSAAAEQQILLYCVVCIVLDSFRNENEPFLKKIKEEFSNTLKLSLSFFDFEILYIFFFNSSQRQS